MPRPRKYVNDAARKAAYRKRQKSKRDAALAEAAAAAAIPKNAQSILRHLASLRDEIPRRLAALGCERKRKWIFQPDPSAPGYGFLLPGLLRLLNFIEKKLDMTGVLADRALTVGEVPRDASLVQHLESLRDEITRKRAAVGFQRKGGGRRPLGPSGSEYTATVSKLIDLLNTIQKELDQSASWPIKA